MFHGNKGWKQSAEHIAKRATAYKKWWSALKADPIRLASHLSNLKARCLEQSWNRGKHLTEEHRNKLAAVKRTSEWSRKISHALKGHKHTPEHIANWIAAMQGKRGGKPLTTIHRKKISSSLIGHPVDEHTRHAVSKANAARIWSSTMRQKLSHSLRDKPSWNKGLTKETDLRLAALSRALLGKPLSARHRYKIARALHTPEMHRRFLERNLKMYQDGIFGTRPNKFENALQALLDSRFPQEWKYVGKGEVHFGYKIPDFVNINGRKLIIEAFGDYWHKGDTGIARKRHFQKFGFFMLIIREKEMKFPEKVLGKVQRFIETYDSRKNEGL